MMRPMKQLSERVFTDQYSFDLLCDFCAARIAYKKLRGERFAC